MSENPDLVAIFYCAVIFVQSTWNPTEEEAAKLTVGSGDLGETKRSGCCGELPPFFTRPLLESSFTALLFTPKMSVPLMHSVKPSFTPFQQVDPSRHWRGPEGRRGARMRCSLRQFPALTEK